MKYKRELCLAGICFLMAFLCAMSWVKQREENLAGRIAPALLRFHVLANSNSAGDQELKLLVKDLLLDEISRGIAGEYETSDGLPDHGFGTVPAAPTAENTGGSPSGKEAVCRYIAAHCRQLEQTAEDYMRSLGYDYPARIQITQAYFPTKAYGDVVLPCGTYDTVQVRLGAARGRNWWCLLYPRLCFIDPVHGSLPEKSKEELRCLVTEQDYAALVRPRGIILDIRFRFSPFSPKTPDRPEPIHNSGSTESESETRWSPSSSAEDTQA